MNQSLLIGGLLAGIALLAMARIVAWQLRAEVTQRLHRWRMGLLLLAQPLCALLLYLALFPPTQPTLARTMVVATAAATPALLEARHAGEVLVAMPEAAVFGAAGRAPDLATALRRYRDTARVRVVGRGLEARDRDAVGKLALEFQPVALPRGVVEFSAPQRVAAGDAFRLGGRIEAVRGGSVELIDPGRQRVDVMALPADGRFTLGATTRVPGLVMFKLRLRDARRALVETIDVPLQVIAAVPPRLLVLAAAPDAELKYLRRWAADAGLSMHTQISVGAGMRLGDAPIALDAANLARFDLVILDERAWTSLGADARGALVEALRGGLGVLLRITGKLPASTRAQLRDLGFVLEGGGEAASVRLAKTRTQARMTRARIGPGTRDVPTAGVPINAPELTRRAWRIGNTDTPALLRDAAGASIGVWRAEGRGRIGLWTLADSYRLVLAGRRDMHGEVWSAALAALVRTHAEQPPRIESMAWTGERMTLCGQAADFRVIPPDGVAVQLLPDPASGAPSCAGFWPRASGWHVLQQGDAKRGKRWPFYVLAPEAAAGLRASVLREATLRLASAASSGSAVSPGDGQPGPRWPWFLGWLVASAGLWWLERARAGRMPRS